MRILFLTNIPSPYRVDFFQELGKFCELTVCYEMKKAGDRDAKWRDHIEEKNFHEIYLPAAFELTSSAWCPSVTKYLDLDRYDIIVVGVYATPTGMTAISYMKRHRIPYVLNADGGMVPETEAGYKRWVKRHFISGAYAYLSTGYCCDEYLVHYGATRERVFRYPFSSVHDTDLADSTLADDSRRRIREALGITEEKMVLYVGSYIYRKGLDILLQAVGQMHTACGFYLVGGEPTPEYERIVEENGLTNVHFLPFMTGDEVSEYYRAADLFVLPTREDIWGLVVNEALSYGLPVVTTDQCMAGVELVDDDCGIIVPAENPEKLAEAMESILSDKALCENMSEAAIRKARDYTIEKMAERHLEIFEEISRHAENETLNA